MDKNNELKEIEFLQFQNTSIPKSLNYSVFVNIDLMRIGHFTGLCIFFQACRIPMTCFELRECSPYTSQCSISIISVISDFNCGN